MKNRKLVRAVGLSLWLCGAAWASDFFDGEPKLKESGETVEISFSVKEFKDITVEVVNAQGQVLRHLASGMLGPNAPEPFQKDSKKQVISWDLKDNGGKLIDSSSGAKVLIRAGLKPSFERTFGWTGQSLGVIKGMCVDKEGNLYVTSKSMPITYREHTFTKVFNREGKYLRTILPFPANLPESKLKGIQFAELPDNRRVPLYHKIWERDIHGIYVDTHQPVITNDGYLIFPTRARDEGRPACRVAKIGLDGSVEADFAGQQVAGYEEPYKYHVHPRVYLASSPDGRDLYASGVTRAHGCPDAGGCDVEAFDNCIYRIDRQTQDDAVPFIGKKFAQDGVLSNPLGIDVDAAGNVYVSDYGHNRIAVFTPEGVLKHELPVEMPVQVGVHPTGKIYVYTAGSLQRGANRNGASFPHKVVRLSGIDQPALEAELTFPGVSAWSEPCFTLDKHSDKPVIWLGSLKGNGNWFWWKGDIHKIVDNGKALEDLGDVITPKDREADFGRSHKFILVDPKTEEVWWDYFIFDGNTGQVTGSFQKGWPFSRIALGAPGHFLGEPRLGPNDSMILWDKGEVSRYKRDGTPYPFSSTGKNKIATPDLKGNAGRNFSRGVDVDRHGNIYIFGSAGFVEGHKSGVVRRVSEDGTLSAENMISIEASVGGLAVDRKGAIYLGAQVKDYGHALPSHWDKAFKERSNQAIQQQYELNTGSVVKFPPTGGTIKMDAEGTDFQATDRFFKEPVRFKATGVTWSRYIYPVAKANSGKCNCEVTDMEVDGHNRVFVPDPLTYSVLVFDENGNQISRFGEYGNMDSAGPNSKVPVPEIPLSYAFRLAVSDKAVYVSDSHAQRVLKVKLDYEETVCLNLDGRRAP